MRQWYDGYFFGQTEVYNPWSVINYVYAGNVNPKTFPKPYWSNTSSNSIVKELIGEADFETRGEIESLLSDGTIEKPIHEDNPVIIIELKRAEKFSQMESQCQAALRQIEEKHYDAWHREIGYEHYVKYGICFCRKSLKAQAEVV
ncbi:MAG: ATP-binding protein [Roseburia sp.]|nr:ATP-binding protein [Roseburia sp.]